MENDEVIEECVYVHTMTPRFASCVAMRVDKLCSSIKSLLEFVCAGVPAQTSVPMFGTRGRRQR